MTDTHNPLFVRLLIHPTIYLMNITAAFIIWMIALTSAGIYAMERFNMVGEQYIPLFLSMPPSALLALICGGFMARYLTTQVWPLSKTRASMGALLLPLGALISWSMLFLYFYFIVPPMPPAL